MSTSAADPNFMIVCKFFESFSEICGIERPDTRKLKEWLENSEDVHPELVDLHLKLMRKLRKTVHHSKWEKGLIKFCYTSASNQDAWEIERFGYKKSSVAVKLRILKSLLEVQFDANTRFKTAINTKSANDLRTQPIGKDNLGNAYWYTMDDKCNMYIYQENVDDETWRLVASSREELDKIIENLKNNVPIAPSMDDLNEDDSSQDSVKEEKNDCEMGDVKPEEDRVSLKITLKKPPIKEDSGDEEFTKVTNQSPVKITITTTKGKSKGIRKTRKHSKRATESESDVGEEITEPTLHVVGEGSGNDCEALPEFSDVVEENVMYFYGEGAGNDCLSPIGNKDEEKEKLLPKPKSSFFFGPGCVSSGSLFGFNRVTSVPSTEHKPAVIKATSVTTPDESAVEKDDDDLLKSIEDALKSDIKCRPGELTPPIRAKDSASGSRSYVTGVSSFCRRVSEAIGTDSEESPSVSEKIESPIVAPLFVATTESARAYMPVKLGKDKVDHCSPFKKELISKFTTNDILPKLSVELTSTPGPSTENLLENIEVSEEEKLLLEAVKTDDARFDKRRVKLRRPGKPQARTPSPEPVTVDTSISMDVKESHCTTTLSSSSPLRLIETPSEEPTIDIVQENQDTFPEEARESIENPLLQSTENKSEEKLKTIISSENSKTELDSDSEIEKVLEPMELQDTKEPESQQIEPTSNIPINEIECQSSSPSADKSIVEREVVKSPTNDIAEVLQPEATEDNPISIKENENTCTTTIRSESLVKSESKKEGNLIDGIEPAKSVEPTTSESSDTKNDDIMNDSREQEIIVEVPQIEVQKDKILPCKSDAENYIREQETEELVTGIPKMDSHTENPLDGVECDAATEAQLIQIQPINDVHSPEETNSLEENEELELQIVPNKQETQTSQCAAEKTHVEDETPQFDLPVKTFQDQNQIEIASDTIEQVSSITSCPIEISVQRDTKINTAEEESLEKTPSTSTDSEKSLHKEKGDAQIELIVERPNEFSNATDESVVGQDKVPSEEIVESASSPESKVFIKGAAENQITNDIGQIKEAVALVDPMSDECKNESASKLLENTLGLLSDNTSVQDVIAQPSEQKDKSESDGNLLVKVQSASEVESPPSTAIEAVTETVEIKSSKNVEKELPLAEEPETLSTVVEPVMEDSATTDTCNIEICDSVLDSCEPRVTTSEQKDTVTPATEDIIISPNEIQNLTPEPDTVGPTVITDNTDLVVKNITNLPSPTQKPHQSSQEQQSSVSDLGKNVDLLDVTTNDADESIIETKIESKVENIEAMSVNETTPQESSNELETKTAQEYTESVDTMIASSQSKLQPDLIAQEVPTADESFSEDTVGVCGESKSINEADIQVNLPDDKIIVVRDDPCQPVSCSSAEENISVNCQLDIAHSERETLNVTDIHATDNAVGTVTPKNALKLEEDLEKDPKSVTESITDHPNLEDLPDENFEIRESVQCSEIVIDTNQPAVITEDIKNKSESIEGSESESNQKCKDEETISGTGTKTGVVTECIDIQTKTPTETKNIPQELQTVDSEQKEIKLISESEVPPTDEATLKTEVPKTAVQKPAKSKVTSASIWVPPVMTEAESAQMPSAVAVSDSSEEEQPRSPQAPTVPTPSNNQKESAAALDLSKTSTYHGSPQEPTSTVSDKIIHEIPTSSQPIAEPVVIVPLNFSVSNLLSTDRPVQQAPKAGPIRLKRGRRIEDVANLLKTDATPNDGKTDAPTQSTPPEVQSAPQEGDEKIDTRKIRRGRKSDIPEKIEVYNDVPITVDETPVPKKLKIDEEETVKQSTHTSEEIKDSLPVPQKPRRGRKSDPIKLSERSIAEIPALQDAQPEALALIEKHQSKTDKSTPGIIEPPKRGRKPKLETVASTSDVPIACADDNPKVSCPEPMKRGRKGKSDNIEQNQDLVQAVVTEPEPQIASVLAPARRGRKPKIDDTNSPSEQKQPEVKVISNVSSVELATPLKRGRKTKSEALSEDVIKDDVKEVLIEAEKQPEQVPVKRGRKSKAQKEDEEIASKEPTPVLPKRGLRSNVEKVEEKDTDVSVSVAISGTSKRGRKSKTELVEEKVSDPEIVDRTPDPAVDDKSSQKKGRKSDSTVPDEAKQEVGTSRRSRRGRNSSPVQILSDPEPKTRRRKKSDAVGDTTTVMKEPEKERAEQDPAPKPVEKTKTSPVQLVPKMRIKAMAKQDKPLVEDFSYITPESPKPELTQSRKRRISEEKPRRNSSESEGDFFGASHDDQYSTDEEVLEPCGKRAKVPPRHIDLAMRKKVERKHDEVPTSEDDQTQVRDSVSESLPAPRERVRKAKRRPIDDEKVFSDETKPDKRSRRNSAESDASLFAGFTQSSQEEQKSGTTENTTGKRRSAASKTPKKDVAKTTLEEITKDTTDERIKCVNEATASEKADYAQTSDIKESSAVQEQKEVEAPKKGGRGKRKTLNTSSKDTEVSVDTVKIEKKVDGPTKKKFTNLTRQVDQSLVIDTSSSSNVRQSRRIAEQKIREEADRRKMEEVMLAQMKADSEKKKKQQKDADFIPKYEEDSEEDSKGSRKRSKLQDDRH